MSALQLRSSLPNEISGLLQGRPATWWLYIIDCPPINIRIEHTAWTDSAEVLLPCLPTLYYGCQWIRTAFEMYMSTHPESNFGTSPLLCSALQEIRQSCHHSVVAFSPTSNNWSSHKISSALQGQFSLPFLVFLKINNHSARDRSKGTGDLD